MNPIYLDHNATTSVHPEVMAEMQAYLLMGYGNPSSVHAFGQGARNLLENARQKVAHFLDADCDEILFCSSGTEANNLALIGAARANTGRGRHVLISSIEHFSVLQPAAWLQGQGWEVEYLPCDREGVLDLEAVKKSLRPDTILISCMTANNDTGVLQPIAELSALTRGKGILLHTDAVAAAGKVRLSVKECPVDLLSIAAHKIRGPAGAAALYIHKSTRIEPILLGGSQERKLRAGTENVSGIVGFGKACAINRRSFSESVSSLRMLQQRLESGIRKIPGTILFGENAQRLNNTTYAGFSGVANDLLAIRLDLEGIAVSLGAACHASEREPSHVLLAMGYDSVAARSGVRISLGETNSLEEIERVLQVLPGLVEQLRGE